MQIWSNSKTWKEEWETERDLDGGGQATAKLVKNKTTGQVAFLKILNRQDDIERRGRFFREATAYETSNHRLIPKLIESNAHQHSNLAYKVYLITEYIPGESLTKYVTNSGGLDFDNASRFFRNFSM